MIVVLVLSQGNHSPRPCSDGGLGSIAAEITENFVASVSNCQERADSARSDPVRHHPWHQHHRSPHRPEVAGGPRMTQTLERPDVALPEERRSATDLGAPGRFPRCRGRDARFSSVGQRRRLAGLQHRRHLGSSRNGCVYHSRLLRHLRTSLLALHGVLVMKDRLATTAIWIGALVAFVPLIGVIGYVITRAQPSHWLISRTFFVADFLRLHGHCSRHRVGAGRRSWARSNRWGLATLFTVPWAY